MKQRNDNFLNEAEAKHGAGPKRATVIFTCSNDRWITELVCLIEPIENSRSSCDYGNLHRFIQGLLLDSIE